jgi:hypothetical protein
MTFWRSSVRALFAIAVLATALPASAQFINPPERPWSVEFGIGFDNSISGNINSSAIGTLNGQSTVILKNKYEDVYGTGLHIRFGGGYLFKEHSEFRVTFTLQSLDADLVPMGDLGFSNLYGQYDDYQSFGIDFGVRQYTPIKEGIRGYGEATVGIAIINETDVTLAAPASNIIFDATDFYDQTAAFAFGINVGALFTVKPQMDFFAQLGVRYVTGMSEVDNLVGTGLEKINDKSSRWSIPVQGGVRFRF